MMCFLRSIILKIKTLMSIFGNICLMHFHWYKRRYITRVTHCCVYLCHRLQKYKSADACYELEDDKERSRKMRCRVGRIKCS